MSALSVSKFLKLLTTFSESEIKSFENWLKSPWANSNKNLIRLLEKVLKYYPDFNHRLLTKERLFKQILPKGKYSDRRMNNLLSEGYLAAERFMVFQNLSKDENLQKDLLTKELQKRHLEDWFFKTANQEIERLEEKQIKDWEDHVALLQIHRRVYHHPNQNPRMKPGGRTIVEMGKQLDLIYLLEKGAIIVEKQFRTRLLRNENHEVNKEIEDWLNSSKGIVNEIIELFRMRFEYSQKNQLKNYFKIRELFFKYSDRINLKEQKQHLFWLLNDTSLLVRYGYLDITEKLPLYKFGLKTELLLNKGILSRNTFVGIITSNNTKGDFKYSRLLIANYGEKLEVKIQKDAKNWAKAHTYYWEKDFNTCIDLLIQVNFKNLYFQLLSKVLTTQVYFDLYLLDDSYSELLFNFYDSFERWLYREKTTANSTKKPYLRFIQVCRLLANSLIGVEFKEDKLKEVIQSEENIQALNWLKKRMKNIISIKKASQ